MAELTLEVREEIRSFLETRERRLVNFGAAGLLSFLALVGGFLVYVLDDLRVRGELAARSTIESIRLTEFQPELNALRAQIRETRDDFDKESRRLAAIAITIETYKRDIEELATKAEQALEDLNKAEGSLLFADTILKIRQDIMTLEAGRVTSSAVESNDRPFSSKFDGGEE